MAFKDNIIRVQSVFLETDDAWTEGSQSPARSQSLYVYMTHEMLDMSLRQLFHMRQGFFHRAEVCDLVRCALKGVQCLHGVGITHGELTMGSLYVRQTGTHLAHSQYTLKLAGVGQLTAGSSLIGSQPCSLSSAPERGRCSQAQTACH